MMSSPATVGATEQVKSMTDGVMEAQLCFHCQLPVPNGAEYSVEIDGQARAMCCPGCEAAAQMVVGSDLADFYRYRDICELKPQTNTSGKNKAKDENRFKAYAREEQMAKYCRDITVNGARWVEAELIISGIRCAACVWLLETYMSKHGGIAKASVNLANHRAYIEFDPKQLDISQIFAEIEELGYQAYPYVPSTEESLYQQQSKTLLKALGISAIGMMQVMMFTIALYAGAFEGMDPAYEGLIQVASLLVATPVVFYSARLFFVNAWRDIRRYKVGMDVPVSLAIIAAYGVSLVNTLWLEGEVYYESVSMFTFFLLLSRFIELKARQQQSLSTNELVSVLPTYALRLQPGQAQSKASTVLLDELEVGDLVLIENGATVAVDGVIVQGQTLIDESAFSGESLPLRRSEGEQVFAGSVNVQNPIEIEVTSIVSQSLLSNMVRLVQRAAGQKPAIAQLADKVAGYFVVAVLLLCLMAGCYWYMAEPSQVFVIVLAVLVVSCPCALSLATPVALAVANRKLMQTGLMPTTGGMVSGLAQVDTVLFDKTGTLTEGQLKFQALQNHSQLEQQDLLQLALSLELAVVHPVAKAIVAHAQMLGIEAKPVVDQTVIQGSGLSGYIDHQEYAVGNLQHISELLGLSVDSLQQTQSELGTISVCLANVSEGKLLASLHFSDVLRQDAKQTVAQLQQMGKQVELLSGDSQSTCEYIGKQLGIDVVNAQMKPDHKIRYVEQLIEQGHKVLMVGDGVNDAPALKQAHVSVAMNGAAEFVQAKADGVLLAERLQVLVDGLKLSLRTHSVIKQNMGWALAYNGTSLPLAALGLIPPWLAALGMSTSSLIVLVNSYRMNLNSFGSQTKIEG